MDWLASCVTKLHSISSYIVSICVPSFKKSVCQQPTFQWYYIFRVPKQRTLSSWSRIPGQLCRLPNSMCLALPTAKKGCFAIRFSHDGKSIACACQGKDGFPILVYDVSTYWAFRNPRPMYYTLLISDFTHCIYKTLTSV